VFLLLELHRTLVDSAILLDFDPEQALFEHVACTMSTVRLRWDAFDSLVSHSISVQHSSVREVRRFEMHVLACRLWDWGLIAIESGLQSFMVVLLFKHLQIHVLLKVERNHISKPNLTNFLPSLNYFIIWSFIC